MKRYSQSYLAKHPEKRGADVNATQKALRLFSKTPASIMSFIEGTRFTAEKQQDQQSPYQHLLKPKAGGIGFVISSMNQRIQHVLDITIIYPENQNSLWKFVCRRVDSVKIHVRKLPIPSTFLISPPDNDSTKHAFREWLNQQWLEKDALISALKKN
jgi:hypothetical protein